MSEHLWIVNMLKGPKDCFNLHGSKRECLTQPIQMELSQNQKIFADFFSRRLFVSEIRDYKRRGYLNARKAAYQNTYGQLKC